MLEVDDYDDLYALAKNNPAGLGDYLEYRLSELEPANPPLLDAGDAYIDFLNEAVYVSIHRDPERRFARQMVGVTGKLLGDLAVKFRKSPGDFLFYGPNSKLSYNAPLFTALLPSDLIRADRVNIKTSIHSVADRLREYPYGENPITDQLGGIWLNSLIDVSERPDPPDYWVERWEDERHPEIWTLGYFGISKLWPERAVAELPKLVKRKIESSHPDWDPQAAVWQLYNDHLNRNSDLAWELFSIRFPWSQTPVKERVAFRREVFGMINAADPENATLRTIEKRLRSLDGWAADRQPYF